MDLGQHAATQSLRLGYRPDAGLPQLDQAEFGCNEKPVQRHEEEGENDQQKIIHYKVCCRRKRIIGEIGRLWRKCAGLDGEESMIRIPRHFQACGLHIDLLAS